MKDIVQAPYQIGTIINIKEASKKFSQSNGFSVLSNMRLNAKYNITKNNTFLFIYAPVFSKYAIQFTKPVKISYRGAKFVQGGGQGFRNYYLIQLGYSYHIINTNTWDISMGMLTELFTSKY